MTLTLCLPSLPVSVNDARTTHSALPLSRYGADATQDDSSAGIETKIMLCACRALARVSSKILINTPKRLRLHACRLVDIMLLIVIAQHTNGNGCPKTNISWLLCDKLQQVPIVVSDLTRDTLNKPPFLLFQSIM